MTDFILRHRMAIAIAAAIGMLVWLWFGSWRPEAQIRHKQTDFIDAITSNDYGTYSELISASYRDQWEHDRDDVLQGLRELNGQFMILHGEWILVTEEIGDGEAEAVGSVRLSGRGNPIGQAIITRANRLAEPFTFTWRKESWTPWSWKLVSVSHPTLRLPDERRRGGDFF